MEDAELNAHRIGKEEARRKQMKKMMTKIL